MIPLITKLGGLSSLFTFKNVLYFFGFLALSFGGYKIYRIFFPSVVDLEIPPNNTLPPPTITELQATQFANQFETYMKGWGTTEEPIEMILDRINANDLILIYSKFGLRKYSSSWNGPTIMQNLNVWFQGEFMAYDETFKKYKSLSQSANLW